MNTKVTLVRTGSVWWGAERLPFMNAEDGRLQATALACTKQAYEMAARGDLQLTETSPCEAIHRHRFVVALEDEGTENV